MSVHNCVQMLQSNSDSVIRVNDSTRVTIFGDSDSTGVTLRIMLTRLELQSMTRVRVIFTKSRSVWRTNPVCLHTKKWAFFASVMIKIGANFLFWLSRRAMPHFKDQVSPTCIEVDLRLHFHCSREQYIDTLSWFNVVFAYRDHRSGSHTIALILFQIPAKWFKIFRFKSNPKII